GADLFDRKTCHKCLFFTARRDQRVQITRVEAVFDLEADQERIPATCRAQDRAPLTLAPKRRQRRDRAPGTLCVFDRARDVLVARRADAHFGQPVALPRTSELLSRANDALITASCALRANPDPRS